MKKSKKNKWFTEKKQQHKSFKASVSGDDKPDSSDKIEESVENDLIEPEEAEPEEAEPEEAEPEEAEPEEAEESLPIKNSRLARLDGLKERMNNKKIWK